MAQISSASRNRSDGGPFLESSVKTELARLIKCGKDTGEIRPDVDPVLVGAILATAYDTTIQRWMSTEPPPFNVGDELEGMLDILLHGLLADGAT